MRVVNRDAREYVQKRVCFKGSNTFAEVCGNNGIFYVVYSYGYHFPMYVWDGSVWLENSDKYSRSTSRHQSQLHPLEETVKMGTKELLKVIGC